MLAPCLVLGATAYGQPDDDATPVVAARVIQAEVNTGRRFVGTVHPRRTSTIGSAIDGRVESFEVDAGQPVKQGQTLARLRTATLKIERAIAKAELDLYQQRLAELENGSRPEDIAEATANVRSAEASVKAAASNLQRLEALAARNAASTAELEDARERAESAQFALQATQALLKRLEEGPRLETIAQAKAQVDLGQQRFELAEDRIQKAQIVAPFDGFVSAEFTEVGAWISRGDPIAEVVEMREVEIRAPVTAEAVVNLRKGDVIRVEFPELPDQLLTGKIERIVPVADMRTRTFPVHIRLANPIRDDTPLLLAGMLARVDLPAGRRETLPLVPKDALVLNGSGRSVYVIDGVKTNDAAGGVGVARKVDVDLGVAVGDYIQVRGAIKDRDLVVVVGNERLTPNAKVKVMRELDGSSFNEGGVIR